MQRLSGSGRVLQAEGAPQPLAAGSATFHHARTMHYSRGNSTDSQRRALVSNFRPAAMVEYERQKDYDYGRSMVGIGLGIR